MADIFSITFMRISNHKLLYTMHAYIMYEWIQL